MMNTINATETLTTNASKTVIATHDGLFHLDEMVAISLLILGTSEPKDEGTTSVWDDIEIIRTRDFDKLFHSTFLVDVGMEFNGMDKFDHHQLDCPVHTNGIPYAATGLVWESVVSTIARENDVSRDSLYKAMESFILAVDANDTGKAEPDKRDIKLPNLAEVVKSFNSLKDNGFEMCLHFIFNYVSTLLHNAIDKIKDESLIQEAINTSKDGILVLPKFCLGWKEAVMDTDIKVALIDAGNGEWSITSALVEPGSQDCKCACPEALRANRVLGGNPVVFIHKTGFTGKVKADSLEQAYKSALEWVNG